MDIINELKKFKEELYKYNYENNHNNYIYLRLSKINTQLPKEEQIKDTINKLRADYNKLIEIYPKLLKEGFKLFIEVKSAYKNSTREIFIDLYENYLFKDLTIKDILENSPIKEKKNLYLASFDRISRVFFYSLSFQLIRKLRGINIHTTLSEEINFEKKNINIINKENLEQTMFVFQLMMFSSTAGKQSEDMSNKIKRRVVRNKKGTYSSKTGNKWGVAKTISNNMRKRIKERFKSFTAKDISTQKDIYQIVKGKKLPIAENTIRSIVRE